MNITTVSVENFRSIQSATFKLGDYSLLVGQNNAGKSNVIDALRTFFKHRAYSRERDLPKGAESDCASWIEVEFELTDEEVAGLSEVYRLPNNRLRVRRWLAGGPKESFVGYTRDSAGSEVPHDTNFYSDRDGLLGNIMYVPALSRTEEHVTTSGKGSTVAEMLRPILEDIAKAEAGEVMLARQQIESAIETIGKQYQQRTKSLTELINTEIAPWGLTFDFIATKPDLPKMVEGLLNTILEHSIVDPTVAEGQKAESFGQGFQRQLIYTVLKIRSKHQIKPKATAKASKGKKTAAPEPERRDFSPVLYLMLFEEPEAFLHPEQMDVLHDSLEILSRDYGNQVLVATHSPHFVSRRIEDMTAIVRAKRAGRYTALLQIDDQTLSDLLRANIDTIQAWKNENVPNMDQLGQDDLTTAVESLRYLLYLNPHRSYMFFASRVLMVEGATELALMHWLLANAGAKLGCELEAGVKRAFCLDAVGKYNFPRIMRMLDRLGVEHFIVYDLDRKNNLASKNEPVNRSIDEERARCEFSLGSFTVEKDLETYLGFNFPKNASAVRKPYLLLAQLESDELTEGTKTKLREFVAMLNHHLGDKSAPSISQPPPPVAEVIELPLRRVARYDLKVAAGTYSGPQRPSEPEMIEVRHEEPLTDLHFVVQVVGHSMLPRVQSGQWCLFKHFDHHASLETLKGKDVIVECRDLVDEEFGSCYTFKRVHVHYDLNGQVDSVELRPLNSDFKSIPVVSDDVIAIGEFLTIVLS